MIIRNPQSGHPRQWVIRNCLFLAIIVGLALQLRSAEDSGEISVFLPKNPKYAARMLKIQPNKKLVRIKRSEPVYIALVGRHGIDAKYRQEALKGLAELRKTDIPTELLSAVTYIDQNGITKDPDDESSNEPTDKHFALVADDLTRIATSLTSKDWSPHRAKVATLVATLKRAPLRSLAYAGLITADEDPEAAWKLAARPTETSKDGQLADLLGAVPAIKSAELRAKLYERVMPLLTVGTSDETRNAAVAAIAHIPGHDAEVFAALTALIREGHSRNAAIAAMLAMDRDRWPQQLGALADSLIAYITSLPAEQRTVSPATEAFALGDALASRMPPTAANRLRGALEKLRVRVIKVATVHEEMRYDKDVLVVAAGQTVQVVLTNADVMPHNLVIVAPGALEEIGLASELSSTDPEAAKRHYIPESEKVLHHTRMLQPHDIERLTFTAPAKADVYPIVCTFPGHWRKMYGALVVVEDVKNYLASNDPLPTADMLLGIIKREWKIEELQPHLSKLAAGRSFENGQKLFTKSSCYSCHAMQGKGGRIGPELAEMHKKYKPHELLREIMQPSLKVEEKYARVEVYDDATGKTFLGVVVKRTDDEIHLMEDPLARCEPKVIALSADIEITPSKISPMPEGLLNTITEVDDVLDLLAYVHTGGDPKHAAFSPRK